MGDPTTCRSRHKGPAYVREVRVRSPLRKHVANSYVAALCSINPRHPGLPRANRRPSNETWADADDGGPSDSMIERYFAAIGMPFREEPVPHQEVRFEKRPLACFQARRAAPTFSGLTRLLKRAERLQQPSKIVIVGLGINIIQRVVRPVLSRDSPMEPVTFRGGSVSPT